MKRAIRVVAILGLCVGACGTPAAQPTGSTAGPTASSASAPFADPAAALCAALEEHAAAAAALADLDPATSTVDQLKAAASDERLTLTALVVAFGASGLQAQLGNQFQQIEAASTGILEAIQGLPAGASPADVTASLAAFGWPEPFINDQQALFAALRGAACTSEPSSSANT